MNGEAAERHCITTAARVSRDSQMTAGLAAECGAGQAREIVEARRMLIAELERRRRLVCARDEELSDAA
jgi:hypothetical protein